MAAFVWILDMLRTLSRRKTRQVLFVIWALYLINFGTEVGLFYASSEIESWAVFADRMIDIVFIGVTLLIGSVALHTAHDPAANLKHDDEDPDEPPRAG